MVTMPLTHGNPSIATSTPVINPSMMRANSRCHQSASGTPSGAVRPPLCQAVWGAAP